jgi:mycoredoxin
MIGTLTRRWASSVIMIMASGSIFVNDDRSLPMIVLGALFLVLAYVLSPGFFPRSPTDAQARRRASEQGVPVIYWRVGCSYCLRLRIALGLAGNRAVWVDVSRDPGASERVRAVTGGDETVPTVFADTGTRINPNPSWVRAQLRVQ